MELGSKELVLVFRIEVTINVNERKDADVFRAYLKQAGERYEEDHEGLSIGAIQMDQINIERDETDQRE